MKGLNVKRIAAIGLGAALVGSVLAPAVMAATVNNLTSLKKTDIVSDAGVPVVDIIVGSQGKAADVVWAGNIAAKVAQLATIDVAGAAATKTVDYTVGGTTSMEGAGLLEEITSDNGFTLATGDTEFDGMEVDNTEMPSLINNVDAEWELYGVDTQLKVEETITADDIEVYAQVDAGSSAYAFEEMVAAVPKGKLKYTVSFDEQIPLDVTDLDSNKDMDITIPFLGKTYVVDEVNDDGTEIILYADTLPKEVEVGEKITVTPTAAYAGKKVEVQLTDLFESEVDAGDYEAKWAVIVDGVIEDYYSEVPDYDLKDVFDDDYFVDSVNVTRAGKNSSAGTYVAEIRTGTERLKLVNDEGFPFADDDDIDSEAQWEVSIDADGTGVNSISITNQWSYEKDSGSETETSKYVLKVGEEIVFPEEFAVFKYMGWDTSVGRKDVVIGESALEFTDIQGNNVEIPYYEQFEMNDDDQALVDVAGKEFTLWVDGNQVYYQEGDYLDADDATDLDFQADYNMVSFAANVNVPVSIDLGVEDSDGDTQDVDYLFAYNPTTSQAALFLAAQDFEVYTDGADEAWISFVDSNGGTLDWYLPYYNDIEDVLNIDVDDDTYVDAVFEYENLAGNVAELVMRAGESAKVWGSKELSDDDDAVEYGPSYDATYGGVNLSEDEDDVSILGMEDGSSATTDGDTFVISVPEELVEVEAYLGSTEMKSSTTGGTSYDGVKVGETKGNVTIDAIAGATTGKSVVKVGNIVKLDSAAANGKSIIVGGYLVNTQATNLTIDGVTIQDRLKNNGDWVAAVLPEGKIVVAGWTAEDTGSAASALITALEGFM